MRVLYQEVGVYCGWGYSCCKQVPRPVGILQTNCQFHSQGAVDLEDKTSTKVAWPSGLRRWFKAPVTKVAWVRIPPLPELFFFHTIFTKRVMLLFFFYFKFLFSETLFIIVEDCNQ